MKETWRPGLLHECSAAQLLGLRWLPEASGARAGGSAAGKDHQAGANDSLIYNSLFSRIMGNTVRMLQARTTRRAPMIASSTTACLGASWGTPCACGRATLTGSGSGMTSRRSAGRLQQQAEAWSSLWNTESGLAAEGGEGLSQMLQNLHQGVGEPILAWPHKDRK